MNFATLLYWLVLCATPFAFVIEVDNANGDDSTSCLSENGEPCKTLEYALVNGLTSSTTIMIHGGVYSINHDNLSFSDLINITICGAGSNLTTIKCHFGAGVGFFNVTQLVLANFTLFGGGKVMNSTSINPTTGDVAVFRVALYLQNCSIITIEDLVISNSTGTGLVMYDATSKIAIMNSVFQYNMPLENETLPGDGGVSILFSLCKHSKISPCDEAIINDTLYSIQNCTFLSNIATTSNNTILSNHSLYVYRQFGCGGGLKVMMRGVTQNNTVLIKDSVFLHNQAVWGGGLCALVLDDPKGNYFGLENLLFDGNMAGDGGGAVRIAVIPIFFSNYNTGFDFTNCSFFSNLADVGGGMSFKLIREIPRTSTFFNFTNCTWHRNIGRLGSAIDTFVHMYPLGEVANFTFDSCNFIENSNDYSQRPVKPLGLGAMYLWSVPVLFRNKNTFVGNNGSALVGISTWCIFEDGAVVTFDKNTAKNGGAITLLDNSYLILNENTKLNFTDNSADNEGGAIYAVTDVSPYDWREKNITVYFANNSAKNGNSIFATTLDSCIWRNIPFADIKEVFYWNGTFIYEGVNISGLKREISSEAAHIQNLKNIYSFPPGKLYYFDFIAENGKGEGVETVYFVTTNDSSVAVVDDTVSYTSASETLLYGAPGSVVNLKMVTVNSLPLSVSIDVKLDDCPPGFYESIETRSNKTFCKCSANMAGQDYLGIVKCDSKNMVAYLLPGYYAGYVKLDKKQVLLTAGCPEGYCHSPNSGLQLPPNSSSKALDDLMCGPKHRTGVLCGKCSKDNYIYVNSYDYECGKCTNSWIEGAFLLFGIKYIPLVVFLYIIGLFGISLVDGPLNSVVLFSQLLPYMNLYSSGGMHVSHHNKIFHFLYGMWSLDFFELVWHNFCVLPVQSALEMLLFKNLTPVLVGFMLSCFYITVSERFDIVAKARMENSSSVRKCLTYVFCELCCKCSGSLSCCVQKYRIAINKLNSVVCDHDQDQANTCFRSQGLITCIVLCYAKLTALAFTLLSSATLYGSSKDDSDEHLRVLWLDGTRKYEKDAPWLIVIASLCIFFISVIPVLIIFYPAFDYCCKRNNRNVPTYIYHFYDSLRLCYKGNYIASGFTGVYLCYRIGVLAIYAFTAREDLHYLWQCGFFIIMLLIHCVVQPYRKRIYNIIDGIIFSNMSIISLLSFYRLYAIDDGLSGTNNALTFQLVLTYLPFAYIVLLGPCVKFYKYIKKNNTYGIINIVIQCIDKNLLADSEASRSMTDGVGEYGHPERTPLLTTNC